MDLDSFYSENEIKAWETVLGQKMHYHYGVKSDKNDVFDQAIIDLLEFIQPGSKILDCGCGWGGPAKLIKHELNCDITGITISKAQADYIKDFPVLCENLEFYTPDTNYDVALFVESFTHVVNTADMLKRFSLHVESIIVKDFVSETHQSLPNWGMTIRSKKVFIDELESAGYEVKTYYEVNDFIAPTIEFWKNNLKKLNPEEITGHLMLLNELCQWLENINERDLDISECVIHAQRR
jgi:cyclopropane fatty-acyl-phospholipid synthase-like methyltransferase